MKLITYRKYNVNDTRIVKCFAWFPKRIALDNATNAIIWLQSYYKIKRCDETLLFSLKYWWTYRTYLNYSDVEKFYNDYKNHGFNGGNVYLDIDKTLLHKVFYRIGK